MPRPAISLDRIPARVRLEVRDAAEQLRHRPQSGRELEAGTYCRTSQHTITSNGPRNDRSISPSAPNVPRPIPRRFPYRAITYSLESTPT